jgi:hypothetical protein
VYGEWVSKLHRLYIKETAFEGLRPASVAEPHHFGAAPDPGKIFDAAPAPLAPAPTLLYTKPTFFNKLKLRALGQFFS